jgi:hypothetical protein
MKKFIFASILICILALGINSAKADSFDWSFFATPMNISGSLGSTIGWGYTIENFDPNHFLAFVNGPIQLDTGQNVLSSAATVNASVFDFPVVGEATYDSNGNIVPTVISQIYTSANPSDPTSFGTGLYEITLNTFNPLSPVPIGTTFQGTFTLVGSWYANYDDALYQNNPVTTLSNTADYSVMVTAPEIPAIPEPATLLLMVFGSGVMGIGVKRLRKISRNTK